MISIVIPCYNESENIQALAEGVRAVMQSVGDPFELIIVDDGSSDGTLARLRTLKEKGWISYVSLSRNFGHQAALKAGLDLAQGDAVITMDGDLQHPPSVITQLITKWREGYPVVNTIRTKTQNEGLLKMLTSKMFYRLFQWISGLPLEQGSADFRLLDQKVVKELRHMNEPNLFLRGLINWMGFNTASISYMAEQRRSGNSKYSITKMMTFARDGLMSFSIRPLRAAGVLGLIISAGSGFYVLYSLWVVAFTDRAVPGWASILVSVLFVGGVQMIFLGLLGEYVGKIFIESKRRPVYIIKEAGR